MTDLIAGRFALCDPIGRGGSGTVWRAYDRKLNRLCAAKVLRQRDAGDLLRFVREQSVRVAGPHVLSPYSWAAEDEHVIIASELAEGGSLAALVHRTGPLAPMTVAVLLDQLLEGLGHVHAAGMVHRDVKPANLLLRATRTGPAYAMLADFGLTIHHSDARLTEVGLMVGTPGYLAPELLRGGVVPTPQHDLYAAGQVAGVLLTGHEPDGFAPAPEGIGPLFDVLRALTAFGPERRPASAEQARAALRPALGDVRPQTPSGLLIDVWSTLPPLPADAAHELADTSPDLAGQPTGAVRGDVRSTPLLSAVASVPTSTSVSPPPGWLSTPPLSPGVPTRRATAPRPHRRKLVPALAAVIVATAVAVPVTLALTEGSGGRTEPTAPPTGTLGGTPAVVVHEIGTTCDWQQQGDRARTGGGRTVVCAAGKDRYVWVGR
ncbi:protein kinase [uncultured Jatrophihabitans sp.]|uniref:serine/threonine-protein kinase n=1 Tax=uncultured Jatrophihabitans sp. TaxID=1610747 RepID=UPI0035CA543B